MRKVAKLCIAVCLWALGLGAWSASAPASEITIYKATPGLQATVNLDGQVQTITPYEYRFYFGTTQPAQDHIGYVRYLDTQYMPGVYEFAGFFDYDQAYFDDLSRLRIGWLVRQRAQELIQFSPWSVTALQLALFEIYYDSPNVNLETFLLHNDGPIDPSAYNFDLSSYDLTGGHFRVVDDGDLSPLVIHQAELFLHDIPQNLWQLAMEVDGTAYANRYFPTTKNLSLIYPYGLEGAGTPEPATLLLVASVLGLLWGARRRRARRAG